MTFSQTKLSIMTFSIMTLSKMTFCITTLSIAALSIMTFCIKTRSTMTFSITTLNIITISITKINHKPKYKDIQPNASFLLCWVSFMLGVINANCRKIGLYAQCHYAESRFAECLYSDCHGAKIIHYNPMDLLIYFSYWTPL